MLNVPLSRSAPRGSQTLRLAHVMVACEDYAEVQRLVWRAKESGRAAERLARVVADAVASSPLADSEFAMVTAVPGSPDRVARRGYDIPQLIAVAIAERLSTVYYPALSSLPHVRQSRLGMEQRWLSAQRCYRVSGVAQAGLRMWSHGSYKSRPVMLVDDVCTSGATIAAAMMALEPFVCGVVPVVAAHPQFVLASREFRQFDANW